MKGGYQNRQGAGGLRGQRFSFQKGKVLVRQERREREVMVGLVMCEKKISKREISEVTELAFGTFKLSKKESEVIFNN